MHDSRGIPTAEDGTDQALRWLLAHQDRSAFLLLHHIDPHSPYQPPVEAPPDLAAAPLDAPGLDPDQRAVLAAYDAGTRNTTPRLVPADVLKGYGVSPASLEEVMRESDIVSIHAALTDETRHMIGERELRMMKSTAYLINTARGAIIEERALVKALKEKWIAGAALDVFEVEPLPKDSPLYELDNVFLTPHIAGLSDERRSMLFGVIVEDFKRFFSGEEPLNKVDPRKLKVLA